jgi:hypothetical protein
VARQTIVRRIGGSEVEAVLFIGDVDRIFFHRRSIGKTFIIIGDELRGRVIKRIHHTHGPTAYRSTVIGPHLAKVNGGRMTNDEDRSKVPDLQHAFIDKGGITTRLFPRGGSIVVGVCV